MTRKEELILARLKGPPAGSPRELQEAKARMPQRRFEVSQTQAKGEQRWSEDPTARLVVVLEEPGAPGHPQ
jgi:hypothetical protein